MTKRWGGGVITGVLAATGVLVLTGVLAVGVWAWTVGVPFFAGIALLWVLL